MLKERIADAEGIWYMSNTHLAGQRHRERVEKTVEVRKKGKEQSPNYYHVSHQQGLERSKRTSDEKEQTARIHESGRWREECKGEKWSRGRLRLTSSDCQSPLRNPSAPTSVLPPP